MYAVQELCPSQRILIKIQLRKLDLDEHDRLPYPRASSQPVHACARGSAPPPWLCVWFYFPFAWLGSSMPTVLERTGTEFKAQITIDSHGCQSCTQLGTLTCNQAICRPRSTVIDQTYLDRCFVSEQVTTLQGLHRAPHYGGSVLVLAWNVCQR